MYMSPLIKNRGDRPHKEGKDAMAGKTNKKGKKGQQGAATGSLVVCHWCGVETREGSSIPTGVDIGKSTLDRVAVYNNICKDCQGEMTRQQIEIALMGCFLIKQTKVKVSVRTDTNSLVQLSLFEWGGDK